MMIAPEPTQPTSFQSNQVANKPNFRDNPDNYKVVLYAEEYVPFFPPAFTVLILPFIAMFRKYHVHIASSSGSVANTKAPSKSSPSSGANYDDDFMLTFGFNSIQKQVKLSDIDTATVIEHINGMRDYGGWGIRKKLTNWRTTGYVSKNGCGIKLKLKNTKTKYVFSCDNPHTVVDIIGKYK